VSEERTGGAKLHEFLSGQTCGCGAALVYDLDADGYVEAERCPQCKKRWYFDPPVCIKPVMNAEP
jgi:predicted Zn-ribbon and HTH transcriptional regulator